jgi:hypothetical protein
VTILVTYIIAGQSTFYPHLWGFVTTFLHPIGWTLRFRRRGFVTNYVTTTEWYGYLSMGGLGVLGSNPGDEMTKPPNRGFDLRKHSSPIMAPFVTRGGLRGDETPP